MLKAGIKKARLKLIVLSLPFFYIGGLRYYSYLSPDNFREVYLKPLLQNVKDEKTASAYKTILKFYIKYNIIYNPFPYKHSNDLFDNKAIPSNLGLSIGNELNEDHFMGLVNLGFSTIHFANASDDDSTSEFEQAHSKLTSAKRIASKISSQVG